MVALSEAKHIYFIGIGGIGMSALASFFKEQGKQVSGYDKTSSDVTTKLNKEGVSITFNDDANTLPTNVDYVVYTPAIPNSNKVLNYFKEKKISLKKRAQVLGEISKSYTTIAIAGTHGKTTTSAILAHLLHNTVNSCNAFVGGILTNYNSNLLLNKNSKFLVLEADEYDKSFLELTPAISVINSIDPDHLDIYETKEEFENTFNQFANNTIPNGKIICHSTVQSKITRTTHSFSANKTNEGASIKNLRYEAGLTKGTITINSEELEYEWQLPGIHNQENLLAAVTVCKILNISNETIIKNIKSFKGIKRRFQYIYNSNDRVMIDDYAHHPTEITAAIQTVKALYPNKELTVLFQPHLYSRTRDFLKEFATSLSLANNLLLLDIYPARELPIKGVSSENLLKQINIKNKQLCNHENVIEKLKKLNPSLLITLGAGDINKLINPIITKIFTVE